MKKLIRAGAAVVTVACVLSVAVPAGADPSAATPITSAVGSQYADQIALIAGDTQWLVYAELATLGDGTVDSAEAQVMAYDGTDSPEDVGALPVADSYSATQYSLDGSILTTLVDTFAPPNSYGNAVDWWNLSNHTSGSSALTDPETQTYLGASPDGWLYATGDRLYDESTAGVVRTVAASVSFGSGSNTIASGSVGPDGIALVGSNNQVTYVTFAGTSERLAFNATALGYHFVAQCGGTTGAQTVCADQPLRQVSDIHAAPSKTNLVVREVPLDGSASVSVPDSCAGTGVRYDDPDYTDTPGAMSAAVVGAKLICADEFVSSRTNAKASVHTSTYRVGGGFFLGDPPILDSLGRAVVTNSSHDSVQTVTSATRQPRSLFATPTSPLTVGSFALSPGRISWTSDPPATAASASDTASTATVSNADGDLVDGPVRQVAAGVGWTFVAASGENSAYEVRKTVRGEPTWIVYVVSPYRTTTVRDIQPASISLSGNRMLYLTTAQPAAPRGEYLLLNLNTGKSRTVPALEGNEDPPSLAPQLWGSEVLFAGVYSPLTLLSLTTGNALTLPVPDGFDAAGGEFFPHVYGPEVSWMASRPSGEDDGVIANVDDLGTPIVLGADVFVYALTNDGAITYPYSHSNTTPYSYPLSLRGYGAADSTVPLGIDDTAESVPQLDSGVLAWRTPGYQLEASALANPPLTTPLYLGAPYAPGAFVNGASGTWSFSVPYSAPLSGCHMVISKGTTTVRGLPCDPSAMKLGVAMGSWDGTGTSDHLGKPGTYTWTTTVSGASGTTDTRTGTIQVT